MVELVKSTHLARSVSGSRAVDAQSSTGTVKPTGRTATEFIASAVPRPPFCKRSVRGVGCVPLRLVASASVPEFAFEYGSSPKQVLNGTLQTLRRTALRNRVKRVAERSAEFQARAEGEPGAESCVVGVSVRCRVGDSVPVRSSGKSEVESSTSRSRRVEFVPRSSSVKRPH